MAPDSPPCTVSVIVTAFRRTAFLRQALESVLAQTLAADEVIVADDSASAEIRAICDSCAAPVIRYRSNPAPLGVARNVAEAALEARGECVAILNDDDVWEPDFLATLVPALAADPACAIAFSDHWIMSESGGIDEAATERNTVRYGRGSLRAGKVSDSAALVLEKNGVPLAMAAVFRRKAIDWKPFPSGVGGAYDFWISCRLAASGRSFHYSPDRLTRYRLHTAMETARQSADKNENMIFIHRALLADNSFPAWRAHLQRELARALCTAGRYRLEFGQRAVARTQFWESFRTHPSAKAIAGWLLARLPKRHAPAGTE
jgi:glycosyltransferase involved in cell wall biosynthesis